MIENNMKKISVIIPMKNESENVQIIIENLLLVLSKISLDYELVFVNDGSTDNTLDLLLEIQKGNSKIRIIDLSRNFGKEAAVYAGFENCTGDCAVCVDADLQDPPQIITEMVEHWFNGYEIVIAVRSSRSSDGILKKYTAQWFYNLINRMSNTKLVANAGDYRLLDRLAVNAFLQLGEKVRFNKGIFSWIGFKQKLVYHERSERVAGKTKWNYLQLLRLALDGITSFSTVPLTLCLYSGIIIALLSFLYACYYAIKTIIFGIDVNGYPSLLLFILFFGGIQMIGIGILGQYIGRIFLETKNRPIYIARKIHN